MKVNNILEAIGNTPCVKINKLYDPRVNVWCKLERTNPGGSIKDRIALSMIEEAEKRGDLNANSVIIEPTSGNTGIALAMVGSVKGYQVILVMPESMSIERRRYMAALGAKLELTPKEKGMGGAIEKAKELAEQIENAWIPQQFENPDNILAHTSKTAEEIITDFPDGLDYLISGVGTGGHITGCAEVLKQRFPNIKIFAVEPEASAVISGKEKAPHPIQGIGAGFIPKNLKIELLDGVITVSNEEAFEFARQCTMKEGIFLGISSGASLAAVNKKLPEISNDKTILTFNYDTGERYLSIDNLF